MIYGVGTDIVKIERIEKILQKEEDLFLKRICHLNEIESVKKVKKEKRAQKVAKFFGAKEAVSKAFGTGIRQGINFADIEIASDDLGKPFVILHGTTKEFFDQKIKGMIHLSLADENGTALAFVVVEK
ncbi:MAG: holo-ACP synthase [Alphaproteobacteria bacterium]|nr:holo-ACP synthase [Alphaproteobacteria bacterium]